MKKKRFISPLATEENLKKLQEEADKYDTVAIAVAANRNCWVYRNGSFERLTGDVASEVAEILDCSKEEAAQAIYERGNYNFKDEVEEELIEEEEEVVIEEPQVKEEIEDKLFEDEEILDEVQDVSEKLEEVRNLLLENNRMLQEQNGLLALLVQKFEGMLF